MKTKKRICIDLDGVLNNYKEYNEKIIPEKKEGAEKFLKKLTSQGYELYLFTIRNKLLTSKWLIKNNLDKYFKDVVSEKTLCHLFIDDRALNFSGDFNKTIEDINNFEVYWKK